MKTRPKTTACLKLIVLDGGSRHRDGRAGHDRAQLCGLCVELFTREQRDGWTCFGDESDKFGWTPAALRWAHERPKREECRLVVQRSADRGGIRRPREEDENLPRG